MADAVDCNNHNPVDCNDHNHYYGVVHWLTSKVVIDDGEIDHSPHGHHVDVRHKQLHLEPPRWLRILVIPEKDGQAPHVSVSGTNVEVADSGPRQLSGEILATYNYYVEITASTGVY